MRIVDSLIALSVAFISTTALASKPTIQHISGAYGSIEYSANVKCEAAGSSAYAFAVSDLLLTYRPDAKFNMVDVVRNPQLRLRTTVLHPGSARAVLTSNNSLPLKLTLDNGHRTATVSDLRFVVSEQKVKESTSTILDLTDGHLIWPFPNNLKSCALSSSNSFEADGSTAAQLKR
jgi:hypothetical protein